MVGRAAGLGTSDHLCWAYDDARDFARPALDWLLDGRALNQRLLYVSGRSPERMRRDVAGLPDVDEMLATGALDLVSLADVYDLTAPLVPEQQLATYDEATRAAAAAGYAGLRVLAEVTDLVADPSRHREHVRWEHLADDYMADHPMAAMCAYRRSAVDADTLADLATVHPVVRDLEPPPPFRLFFDDGRLVLVGSVDAFGSDRLARLLGASHLTPADRGTAVLVRAPHDLDVSGLDFIDARGATTLAEWCRSLTERGATPRILGASPLLRRMWSLLRLDVMSGVAFGS
jgi:ABC-type transporter Mla MlaB component